MTHSNKINSLQVSVIWHLSNRSNSPTKQFVAQMAFSAEDTIEALQQLQQGQFGDFPEPGRSWIMKAASEIADDIFLN